MAVEAQLVCTSLGIDNPFAADQYAVRLQSGALAVFSPVALTEDVKKKVAEMGEVKYITALDAEVCPMSAYL